MMNARPDTTTEWPSIRKSNIDFNSTCTCQCMSHTHMLTDVMHTLLKSALCVVFPLYSFAFDWTFLLPRAKKALNWLLKYGCLLAEDIGTLLIAFWLLFSSVHHCLNYPQGTSNHNKNTHFLLLDQEKNVEKKRWLSFSKLERILSPKLVYHMPICPAMNSHLIESESAGAVALSGLGVNKKGNLCWRQTIQRRGGRLST